MAVKEKTSYNILDEASDVAQNAWNRNEESEEAPRGGAHELDAWRQARKQLGKKIGKQIAKQGGKRALQAGLSATGVGIVPAAVLEALTNERLRKIAIIIFVSIVALLFIVVAFFTGTNGTPEEQEIPVVPPGSGEPGTGTRNEILGLTLQLRADKDQVANGENIVYTLTITYDASFNTPLDSITIYNNIPTNAEFVNASGTHTYDSTNRIVRWPLSDIANRPGFTITLKPTQPDSEVVNRLYAVTTVSSGGSGGGGGGTAKCSVGIDLCSPDYLRPYFGDQAEKASIVCNAESSGNPNALNPNCQTNDYSVGLFQINLVAHCPGAYGPGRWGSQSCDNLLSKSRRDQCEAQWRGNPVENIRKVVEIYRSQTWAGWGAARACGVR